MTDDTADSAGIWLPITDLAKLKGVTKQAMAKRVSRFERDGLLVTQSGPRGAKLVNVSDFDRAAEEFVDGIKALAARTVHCGQPSDGSLAAAQRDKIIYETELKKLELLERQGRLLLKDHVLEAARRCSDTAVTMLVRLELRSEEMNDACQKDGIRGARSLFKRIIFDLRREMAAAFRALAAEGEAAGPVTVDIPDD
jgi:DNA-binding MarR family transcriptional regulator